MKFTTNIRVEQSHSYDSKKFSDYLLSIDNGKVTTNETERIKLSEEFCNISFTLKSFINSVYPNMKSNIKNRNWLQERAILTPLNIKDDEVNTAIQKMTRAAERTNYSIDKCTNEDEGSSNPVEFLNSLSPNGIPAHKLELNVGSPIMLLRNMNRPKLCNGTRLTVKALHRPTRVIEATILIGSVEGKNVLIPRIPLIPSDLPFSFKRLQFPVRLAFAITINKSQRQQFQVTGLDLTDECFSHEQLYVGMSKAKELTKVVYCSQRTWTNNKRCVHSSVEIIKK